MRLPQVFLLIAFCFGCCNTEENVNLRLRLSAKVLDAWTYATANKPFTHFYYEIRIEGKVGNVTYQLDPDTHKAEISFEMNNLYIYHIQLHSIGSIKFEIGIQIQKTPDSDDIQLIMSKCNVTATPNTNVLEIPYVTGFVQDLVCQQLQYRMEWYVRRIYNTKCKPVEPSGVFSNRIEISFNCKETVENCRTGETSEISTGGPVPPMPEFEADQSTIEIQSTGKMQQVVLVWSISPLPGLGQLVSTRTTSPLFTQIVPILSQIANATDTDPNLYLAVHYTNFTFNSSHLVIGLNIEETILSEQYGYRSILILSCYIKWKLTIQISDGRQRWLDIHDMQNANVTFDDISARVAKSILANDTGIANYMCNQLHTAFKRDQIIEQMNIDRYLPFYSLFSQDSALVLKIDLGKFFKTVFASNLDAIFSAMNS